jgi:hypothetical protein
MIIPWKKRLKTTPNAVRRAGLLAAPFVLLGAGKAEADTAFTNFAFPANPALLPGGIARTQPDRITDFVSVREFGSLTAGATCRATMQTAFNSGYSLYFPARNYDIDGPIIIPADARRRVIQGAGPGDGTGFGTLIRGNFRDYLWKTPQLAGYSVSSISGIGFQNYHNPFVHGGDPITSPDPPGVGAHPGNGCGCLYLHTSWTKVTNVILKHGSGVGLYFPGINNYISGFQVDSTWGGYGSFSCGVWGGGIMQSAKVMGEQYGIVVTGGPAMVMEMDIERCYIGVNVTGAPLAHWDRNSGEVYPIYSDNPKHVVLSTLNFESMGSGGSGTTGGDGAAIACNIVGGGIIENIIVYSFFQIGEQSHGIRIDGGDSNIFRCIDVSDKCNVAGIGFGPGAQTKNLTFQNCVARTYGGAQWLILPAKTDSLGHRFINCNTTGAVPYASLHCPPYRWGDEQVVSDSPIPTFDTVSNVGKVLTVGGGTNTVKVRWQPLYPPVEIAAAGAFGVSDGSGVPQTIAMSASNPGTIFPGMGAMNKTTGLIMNKVQSYTGSTLVLAPDGNMGGLPSGSADIIQFWGWHII